MPKVPRPSQREREREISQELLVWYEAHRRDLPWRRTQDPYRIWVAEVMLQQTQVATAIPYYERFLERFPTVEDLACAPFDEVLKVWEGLGYYARARHLHAAAKEVVKEFQGEVPPQREALLKLPGIGPYTAGAVLSIAFGQDEPALDGNVRRVLCRLFCIAEDPGKSATQRALWGLARRLLPAGRAGPFNQALMELGATICVRKPRCPICPLSKWCGARRWGLQEVLPLRKARRARPHYDVAAGVIRKDGDEKVLIVRRPLEGLLGGLWELPGGKRLPDEPLETCLRRAVREELGIEIAVEGPLGTVEHGYSHFRVTVHAFRCAHLAGEPQALGCADWAWVGLKDRDLSRYAFHAANHKVITALRQARGTFVGELDSRG